VKRDLKTGEDEFDDCRLRVLRVVQATTPSPTAKFASANRLVSFSTTTISLACSSPRDGFVCDKPQRTDATSSHRR